MIEQLWFYQVRLVPRLLAYIIYDAPGLLRKLFNFHYIPIYLAVFPLNEINPLVAKYYNEREDVSQPLTESESEEIKRVTRLKCTTALVAGAIALPLLSGFLCSFFLPPTHLLPLFVVIITLKLRGVIESIWDFRLSPASSSKSIILILVTYIVYFLISFQMMKNSFSWAVVYTSKGNYLSLADDLTNVVVGQFFVGIVILGFLGNYLSDALLNKKDEA